MNVFCDTSALIKKYISEKGSAKFEKVLNKADNVYVSVITEIESVSTFKRLLVESEINENDYSYLKNEFEYDYQYFSVVTMSEVIIDYAKILVEKYQLKTLDSIQLASVVFVRDEIDYLLVCDEKLIKAASREKIKIINPNK